MFGTVVPVQSRLNESIREAKINPNGIISIVD